MANDASDVNLLVRLRCFLCDAYRHPWALIKVNDEWVCRQCANFEGEHRLQYTINNTRMMKNYVRSHLSIKYKRLIPSGNTDNDGYPEYLFTLPTNACRSDRPISFVDTAPSPPVPDPRLRSRPNRNSPPVLTPQQPIVTTVTRANATLPANSASGKGSESHP